MGLTRRDTARGRRQDQAGPTAGEDARQDVDVAVVAFADTMAGRPARTRPASATSRSRRPRRTSRPWGSADRRAEADIIFSITRARTCARPTQDFRRYARAVREAGANLFWGHSAPSPSIEVWKGGRSSTAATSSMTAVGQSATTSRPLLADIVDHAVTGESSPSSSATCRSTSRQAPTFADTSAR
jgi:hypothetical protein